MGIQDFFLRARACTLRDLPGLKEKGMQHATPGPCAKGVNHGGVDILGSIYYWGRLVLPTKSPADLHIPPLPSKPLTQPDCTRGNRELMRWYKGFKEGQGV